MNEEAYVFSRYLLVLFSKYQKNVKDWKDMPNDFVGEVERFTSRFNEFHKKVDDTLNASEINYKGKEVADKEIEQAITLKAELEKYAEEFNNIGTGFVSKYQAKIANKEAFESDEKQIKEFLVEYNAFDGLDSANYWLDSLGWALDRHIQTCQKAKDQTQPGAN